MLTETLSGECPCCGYNKLLQRYGSFGYLQLDGCAKCGFGYSSDGVDDNYGVSSWLGYGKHILSCYYNYKKTEKSHERIVIELDKLIDEDVRLLVFEWCESQERCDDIEKTIFEYSDEDILKYKSFNLPIYDQKFLQK